MSVDTAVSASEDLFGKVISDLQSGITIGEDSITGTLKYVSDYTGFSGDASLQSGNFLVLHSTTNHDGATITVTVTNPVTLDDDGIVVLRVANKDTQTVTISVSKEGYETVTKVYSLSGLTCEVAPA